MFTELKTEQKIGRKEFKDAECSLRNDLIEAQLDLLEAADFPVILLLSGMDFPGRSAVAKRLISWMDPRHIRFYAQFRNQEAEISHPRMWRFWRDLPPKGTIGMFLNSWYEDPVSNFLAGTLKNSQYKAQLQQILRFERMLSDEGALLLKFFFHTPKGNTKRNLKDVVRKKNTAWKLSEQDIRIAKHLLKEFDQGLDVVEDVVKQTSTAHAPWIPIPCIDANYRDITVSQKIIDAIRGRLSVKNPVTASTKAEALVDEPGRDAVATLDYDQKLEGAEYKKRLKKLQRRIGRATLSKKFEKRGFVVVFEGNDAAGKGGSIRRFTEALDPRLMRLVPVAAPTDEERAQPYLWRFWRHIPERGRIVIFDRSWYGRVLVERVEGLCPEADWQRAYREIREFEEELAEHRLIVVKIWLAIDRDEQLRRFKSREETPYKRYKITEEDWRNREKWDDYALAVRDMINRTSTERAPWTPVAANDKRHARVAVLQTIMERLEYEL